MAEPFVTIDSAFSKDLDDAIHIAKVSDGWRVLIAISDVASAVPIGDPLDRAAQVQAYTIYRGIGARRPMLPHSLSEEAISLLQGQERRIVVTELILNQDLEILDHKIYHSTLTVDARFDHAQAIVASAAKDAVGKMLANAFELTEGLFHKRVRGGALASYDPAAGLMINEDGGLVTVGKAVRAYRLVQELMILANASAARNAAQEGVHLLYRNQRARPTASRRALAEDADYAARGLLDRKLYSEKLQMLLERAHLGPYAEGHFCLNLPAYAWTTSPIRRYADLVNQRMLLAAAAGEDAPYDADQLAQLALHINGLSDADRKEFSDQAKKKAAIAAREALDHSGGSGLNTSQMSQVLRLASQTGGLDGVAFQEIENRSRDGRLTAKDLYRIIDLAARGDGHCRQLVLRHFATRPEDAPTVLNHASASYGWTFANQVKHDPDGFRVAVDLRIGPRTFHGHAFSEQKKLSMQRALVSAIFSMLGSQSPEEWWREGKKTIAIKSPPPAPPRLSKGTLSDANHKGALIELCTKQGLGRPEFITGDGEGPSHAPIFTSKVSVEVNGTTVIASAAAGSKKAAEARAALDITSKLIGVLA